MGTLKQGTQQQRPQSPRFILPDMWARKNKEYLAWQKPAYNFTGLITPAPPHPTPYFPAPHPHPRSSRYFLKKSAVPGADQTQIHCIVYLFHQGQLLSQAMRSVIHQLCVVSASWEWHGAAFLSSTGWPLLHENTTLLFVRHTRGLFPAGLWDTLRLLATQEGSERFPLEMKQSEQYSTLLYICKTKRRQKVKTSNTLIFWWRVG